MITGTIKNQIDKIWNTFWETGGITNPMTVLEQMTYLFFIKLLDDELIKKEKLYNELDLGVVSDGPYASYGSWTNPETGESIAYNDLRWHTFKQFDAQKMYLTIQRHVFPYIKNLRQGDDSAYPASWPLPSSRKTLIKINLSYNS